MLAKKNSSRDRLINELKEGAKILEDQLRLMDEKYIELRNKLDWTRQHSQKEVRRIQVRQHCVLQLECRAPPNVAPPIRVAGASHTIACKGAHVQDSVRRREPACGATRPRPWHGTGRVSPGQEPWHSWQHGQLTVNAAATRRAKHNYAVGSCCGLRSEPTVVQHAPIKGLRRSVSRVVEHVMIAVVLDFHSIITSFRCSRRTLHDTTQADESVDGRGGWLRRSACAGGIVVR